MWKLKIERLKGTISFVSTDPSGSAANPVPALPTSPSAASSSGGHGVARYDVIVKPESKNNNHTPLFVSLLIALVICAVLLFFL